MRNQTDDRGYGEPEVSAALKSDRFVAIADAYSKDRFTIGLATYLIAQETAPTTIQGLQSVRSSRAFSRLIHDIAKRLRGAVVTVPDDLERRFPEIYAAVPPPDFPNLYQTGLLVHTFSEFEGMSRNQNPLTVWRQWHTDEDIEELARDRRVLACLDALHRGAVSFRTCIYRILGPSRDHPRDLGVVPLTIVMRELLRRIGDGQLTVPPGLLEQFPFAYEEENPSSNPPRQPS